MAGDPVISDNGSQGWLGSNDHVVHSRALC